jgi:uncharacterized protein YdeI (YjbR/CyaY-like superfamily)
VFAKDRGEWRRWLAKYGSRFEEIWLVFYKKDTGKETVSYDHAVEEALCFGWVDGLKKKIDEECYAYRFTPRNPKSAWSKSNLARAERLIADGKMTPAGLKAYQSPHRRDALPMPTEMPRHLEEKFRKNRIAWKNYQKFPPGYRKNTAGWVGFAKREETQMKRLEMLIEHSARNERVEFM